MINLFESLKELKNFEHLLDTRIGAEMHFKNSNMRKTFEKIFEYHAENINKMTDYHKTLYFFISLDLFEKQDHLKSLSKESFLKILENIFTTLDYNKEIKIRILKSKNIEGLDVFPSVEINEDSLINVANGFEDDEIYKKILDLYEEKSEKKMLEIMSKNKGWSKNAGNRFSLMDITKFIFEKKDLKREYLQEDFIEYIEKNLSNKLNVDNLFDYNLIDLKKVTKTFPNSISEETKSMFLDKIIKECTNEEYNVKNTAESIISLRGKEWYSSWEYVSSINVDIYKNNLSQKEIKELESIALLLKEDVLMEAFNRMGLNPNWYINDNVLSKRENLKNRFLSTLNLEGSKTLERSLEEIRLKSFYDFESILNLMDDSFKFEMSLNLSNFIMPKYDGKYTFLNEEKMSFLFKEYIELSDKDFNLRKEDYDLFILNFKE